MQNRAILHALEPEDGRNFDDGFDVVGRVEEGESLREDGEEDDAGGPDVDLGGLGGAFEEDFWGAKASCAGAVCAAGGTLIVFGVAGRWRLGCCFAGFYPCAARCRAVLTETVRGVGSFPL